MGTRMIMRISTICRQKPGQKNENDKLMDACKQLHFVSINF